MITCDELPAMPGIHHGQRIARKSVLVLNSDMPKSRKVKYFIDSRTAIIGDPVLFRGGYEGSQYPDLRFDLYCAKGRIVQLEELDEDYPGYMILTAFLDACKAEAEALP